MTTWYAIYPLSLLFAAGCGQVSPDTAQTIVSQRTVTVSADDPFVEMEDGTRIGVDGVPAGQSKQLKLTQYRASNGEIAVDVDNATEAIGERQQP